ncbi:MAG: FGGY family carbohydrate kinase, partial [Deltaproteobacteria bacterium]
MPETILAIDNGTQSIRAILFDLQGNMLASSRIPMDPPYFSKHPGWAEQDPNYYWNSLCLACKRLWEMPNVSKDKIIGVALTTQRGTVINLDARGNPLRPAILWLDQRKVDHNQPLGGLWGMAFKVLGLSSTLEYLRSQVEATWISKNQPEIWKKTHKFLFLSGYLTYRLTGEFRDSVSSQVGYVPFDYRNFRWSSKWDFKWKVMPVLKEMLPELVIPTGVLGRINKSAGEATGIPVGLPLFAAGSDKACEVIGSGALTPN